MSSAPAGGRPALNRLFRIAVTAGVENAVRLHAQRGDDVNARGSDGLTPLMLAAAGNKASICRILLDFGADPALLDPSGNSALTIAQRANAAAAASVISSFNVPLAIGKVKHEPLPSPEAGNEESGGSVIVNGIVAPPYGGAIAMPGDLSRTFGDASSEDQPVVTVEQRSQTARDSIDELWVSRGAEFGKPTCDDAGAERGNADLGGWEPEIEGAAPQNDLELVALAIEAERLVANHVPIDSSTDWDEFEVDLPDSSASILQARDSDSLADLRRLLLRAIRESSVPQLALEELCQDFAGNLDEVAVARIRLILNDLGAELDERIEYTSTTDDFRVSVSSTETIGEELEVEAAIALLDDLNSNHNDLVRIYLREALRSNLLDAKEEVALSQSMERAIASALDALVDWPLGIQSVIKSADDARVGKRQLNSVTSAIDEIPAPNFSVSDDATEGEVLVPPQDSDTDEPSDETDGHFAETLSFYENVAALHVLAESPTPDGNSRRALREILSALCLSPILLLEMENICIDDHSIGATHFLAAIRDYRAAHDRMAHSNLRLVIAIARKYMRSPLPLEDLIQEGNIGLLVAVRKFDWRRGFKFSTMATWWIRQKITRSIADTGRTVRIPVHAYELLQRIKRESEDAENKTGVAPSLEILSLRTSIAPRKIQFLLRAGSDIESLDNPTGDTENDVEEYPDPYEEVAGKQLRQSLEETLSWLPPREEKVIRLRFGLGVTDSHTLEEVGAQFNLTRERIRQIERKALTKLRSARLSDNLRIWVSDNTPPPSQVAPSKEPEDEPIPLPPDTKPVHGLNVDVSPKQREETAGTKDKDLAKILAAALESGVAVEEWGGVDSPVRIWVELANADDDKKREFAVRLIAAGFEFRRSKKGPG